MVQGISQTLVTHVPGQDDFLLPGGPGDGAGAGVVLTGTGAVVAGGVVAELCEHPGAQDGPQSGLAEVDLSVRVPAKTGLDRPFQSRDLLVGGRDQGGQGADRRTVGGGDKRRLGEVLGTQRGHDRCGFGLPVAPMGPLQCGGDLRPSQPSRAAGLGCLGQQFQDVGGSEVLVGLQGGWEELPQAGTQPQHQAGSVPDQALVHPGQDLHRAGLLAVPSNGAQLVAMGTDQVGQDMSITGIALGSRDVLPWRARADCSGLIAYTWYPEATSAATHGPRSVSYTHLRAHE